MAFDMPKVGPWEVRGGWVVRQLMLDLGLSDYQAAGIVGNLGCESIGFTAFHEKGQADGVGGYGWAQWTAVRRRAFFAWCAEHGLPPASDEANYGYLLAELRGEDKNFDYTTTVTVLKRCTSLESAVFSVGQTYERPGGTTRIHLPGYDSRLSWGRRALDGSRSIIPPEGGIHPTLYRGSKGPAVGELQRRLVALGCDVGPVDGDYGPRTEKAVSDFQKARLIVVPGVAGRSTWNELAQAEAERTRT